MRARQGLTLVEVLTALAALSLLVLLLLAGERWLLLAVTRSSRWLLARDRGRRVIAFIEPRLLHAGLGLAGCRDTEALRLAMGKGQDDAPPVAQWESLSRAIVVYVDRPTLLTPVQGEGGVWRGTGFCVLYARPSGVFLGTPGGGPVVVGPGGTAELNILDGDLVNAGFRVGHLQNLRAWGTLPLAGMPFHLASRGEGRLSLALASTALASADVPPVSELLSLRCERFHVRNSTFRFQGMEADWAPADFYPREEGVLALWVEWRPGRRTFDLWVLTSGGPAVFGPSARPSGWPEEAPWEPGFERHELCVSRASWRLENL